MYINRALILRKKERKRVLKFRFGLFWLSHELDKIVFASSRLILELELAIFKVPILKDVIKSLFPFDQIILTLK